MTKKRFADKTLPAANVDKAVLRAIEQAMPPEWRKVVAWSAVGSSVEIQEANLQDLLEEVSEEAGIKSVGFRFLRIRKIPS